MMPAEIPEPLTVGDPLSVGCADCHAPAGSPCIGTQAHVVRAENAQIAATRADGTCLLCGHPLIAYTPLRGERVAVHVDPADAALCPKIPDPLYDMPGWSAAINLGLEPGKPGLEQWRPLTLCPECAQGKHGNCVGQAMRPDDTLGPCECRYA